MARELYYRVTRTRESEYQHLTIEVWHTEANLHDRRHEQVKFTWQSDRSSERWYGFNIVIRTQSYEQLQSVYRLTKRLLGRLDDAGFFVAPQEIIAKLQRLSATRVVYDSRLGYHDGMVPIGEVLPDSYQRYYDRLNGTSQLSVLAESEYDAQRLISRRLDESTFVSDSYLSEWLDAGRPVRQEPSRSAPSVESLEDLLDIDW